MGSWGHILSNIHCSEHDDEQNRVEHVQVLCGLKDVKVLKIIHKKPCSSLYHHVKGHHDLSTLSKDTGWSKRLTMGHPIT